MPIMLDTSNEHVTYRHVATCDKFDGKKLPNTKLIQQSSKRADCDCWKLDDAAAAKRRANAAARKATA